MVIDFEKHPDPNRFEVMDILTGKRLKNVVAADSKAGRALVIRTDHDGRRIIFAGRTIYDLVELDEMRIIDRRAINRQEGSREEWGIPAGIRRRDRLFITLRVEDLLEDVMRVVQEGARRIRIVLCDSPFPRRAYR